MKFIAPVLAVVSGWLGQSQPPDAPPIPWTECAWICEDGSGNIYLPDGWRIRAGDHTAGKMKHAVPFRLYCDGCCLYGWDAPKRSVRKVRAVDDGIVDDGEFCRLPHANYSLHFIPSALECGVASGRKVLALDRTAGNVIAVSSDGRIEAPLFSFADKEYAQLVRSVGVLPQTGDLLLGTYWPDCRIYRFRPDGTELRNASWPFRTRSDAMVFSGGRLWAMAGQVAQTVDDSLAVREDGAVGRNAYIVRGIARGAGGFMPMPTQRGRRPAGSVVWLMWTQLGFLRDGYLWRQGTVCSRSGLTIAPTILLRAMNGGWFTPIPMMDAALGLRPGTASFFFVMSG